MTEFEMTQCCAETFSMVVVRGLFIRERACGCLFETYGRKVVGVEKWRWLSRRSHLHPNTVSSIHHHPRLLSKSCRHDDFYFRTRSEETFETLQIETLVGFGLKDTLRKFHKASQAAVTHCLGGIANENPHIKSRTSKRNTGYSSKSAITERRTGIIANADLPCCSLFRSVWGV